MPLRRKFSFANPVVVKKKSVIASVTNRLISSGMIQSPERIPASTLRARTRNDVNARLQATHCSALCSSILIRLTSNICSRGIGEEARLRTASMKARAQAS